MRVLVTGGSGTFGRAYIRRLLTTLPIEAVVSYSRDEVKAASLVEEFGHHAPFKAFLGDVRDRSRLELAMRGVDVVVHAAALKRIDVGAYSPSEVIETNIGGTMNVVNAAIASSVKSVVVISSDKAVAPTNLYGATKYCGETYAVQANAYGYPSGTKISCVRYGNIIGSRGSVFHKWRRQFKAGIPLTLTSAKMTRFVMTIEQATDLVEFARTRAVGGEVFVPLLPAATMFDLAQAIAGREYPIRVEEVLRPGGEKFAESLLNEEEILRTFRACSHLAVLPTHRSWSTDPYPWVGLHGRENLRSDAPPSWVGVEDLREMIAATEACL